MLDDMAQPWSGSAWAFLAALERVPPSRIDLDAASRLLRHLSDRGLRKDRRQLAKAIRRLVEPPAVSGTFDEPSYLAVNLDVARSLAGSPPGSQRGINRGLLQTCSARRCKRRQIAPGL